MISQLNAICDQAMRRPINPDDDLISLGLNPNRAFRIIKALFIDSGVELDINIFYKYRSVRAIAEAIVQDRIGARDKILTLREGDRQRPIFLYGGGVNCFLEMQHLIDALEYDGVIYGISLTDFARAGNNPPSVADEVEAAHAAVKAICPQGPYRLLGYSFGGVYALELARRLENGGGTIEFLSMLDSPQNDHSWSFAEWAGLMWRIIRRQVACRFQPRAKRKRTEEGPRHDFGDPRPGRNHQLLFRFRNPRNPRYPVFAPQWAGDYTPDYARAGKQLIQMKGLFRPKAYGGKVVFFHSQAGSPIDCDARRIWQCYLPNADWVSVAGSHVSMMMGRNARFVAARLAEGLKDAARLNAPQAAMPAPVDRPRMQAGDMDVLRHPELVRTAAFMPLQTGSYTAPLT